MTAPTTRGPPWACTAAQKAKDMAVEKHARDNWWCGFKTLLGREVPRLLSFHD